MGLLSALIPYKLPIKGILWIGKHITDVCESELFDKSKVNEQLLELQMRFEMGQIEEAEFEKKESELLERMEIIRKHEEENTG